MTSAAITIGVVLFLGFLAFGLFGALIAIATSGLEQDEHEPEPHRPIWRAPHDRDAA